MVTLKPSVQQLYQHLWHVISVHMSSLQLYHICELTVAMTDKSSSGFNLCHHKKYSLPSTLKLHRLCENLLEC